MEILVSKGGFPSWYSAWINLTGSILSINDVPHNFRSFMALNCDLRDYTENLKRMNHFKNLYKPNIKIGTQKN